MEDGVEEDERGRRKKGLVMREKKDERLKRGKSNHPDYFPLSA